MPGEKAPISQFGYLAKSRCSEDPGDFLENGKSTPNGVEGVNADMPGAFRVNSMELSQQLGMALVGRKLGAGQFGNVQPINQAIPISALIKRNLNSANRAVSIIIHV